MSSLIEQPFDDGSHVLGPVGVDTNRVSAIKSANRSIAVRYRALGWLTGAAGLAYLCRNAVGVPESTIRAELGLTLAQSGWFMSVFFWSYAIFQIPSGWFAERFGSRIALSIFIFSSSVAMVATGLAPGFWSLMIAQLAMGVAQAGLLPATVNSIGRWMPLSQRSLACGILGAGMSVGAIAAGSLTGALTAQFGWRLVFVVFALPGFAWTLGFFRRFRDDPAEVLPANSTELAQIRSGRDSDDSTSPAGSHEPAELLAIALNPTMWWLCGQQICRSAGYMFFASWFPTFLQKTRGISVENSGYLQGLVLGGALIGGVLGGLLTDWIWRNIASLRASRSGVGGVSLAMCAIVILGAWFVESTELAILLLTLGAFCNAVAGASAFAATIDIAGPRVPQVAGMMNMSGNIAAAACPILVARLFQLTENWNLILLLFAGVFFAGAICWFLVNPQQRVRTVADNS
jgi:ACS family glucarate transporter-like MFS transporter/ACS family D-galactonate transporter-like MFS transporter